MKIKIVSSSVWEKNGRLLAATPHVTPFASIDRRVTRHLKSIAKLQKAIENLEAARVDIEENGTRWGRRQIENL